MNPKKLLTAVLAIACVIATPVLGSAAEDDANAEAIIRPELESYFESSATKGAYFAEGELPTAGFVCRYLFNNKREIFDERCITTEENGFKKYVYEIPADEFEASAFELYAENESTVAALREMPIYRTDRDEPYYSINFKELEPPREQIHIYDYAGYREREDGLIEAWAYVADNIWRVDDGTTGRYEYFEYYPEEGETEGEDYIVIPVWSVSADAVGDFGFRWAPATIFCAVRSVIEVDGENVRLCSFEQVDAGLMPDDLTEGGGVYGKKLHHSTMYFDRDSFAADVGVYEHSPSGGGIHDRAEAILGKDVVSVHEYRAVDDDFNEYQLLKPVTVEISLIFNKDTNVELYRIYEAEYEEDGTVRMRTEYELMDFTVDPETETVTAVIDDINSIYAVTGAREELPPVGGADPEITLGDADGNGKVNLTDCVSILQYNAEWEGVQIDLTAADVTKDGKVNLLDVGVILRYLSGWDYY